MDEFLSSKTVVGEPVKFEDGTIILPLVEMSFGVGAGAWAKNTDAGSTGGGMGGKMKPSSVLIIKDGHVRLINLTAQDNVSKIINLVPEVIDRFTDKESVKDMKDKVKAALHKDENGNDADREAEKEKEE